MKRSFGVALAVSLSALASCAGKAEQGHTDGGVVHDARALPDGCLTAPATVYLGASIGPTASGSCPFGSTTTALVIGSVTSGVATGDGGTVVACSVIAKGAGFDVSAQVSSRSGAFTLSGTMPRSGTRTGVMASLEFGPTATLYDDTNCSVTLANASTPGFDPSTGPPIAPGRIWATLTCADMTVAGNPGACEGIMTFRLENCVEMPRCQ